MNAGSPTNRLGSHVAEKIPADAKIIDAHTHPFGKRGLDLSNDIKEFRDPILLRWKNPALWREMFESTDDLTDELIRDMDDHGIDKAVIQSRGVGGVNEDVARAVERYPDRLVGLFRPVYKVKDSGPQSTIDYGELGAQVDIWVSELGLKGMGEIRLSRFTSEAAPERISQDLIPLMEIMACHKVPVMFLTAWTQFGTALYHGMPLFVDDLAERFPEVPIIITKMGRGYDILFEMCLLIAYKHPNVYLDTVQSRPEHVARAVSEIGSNRVMFGTDWEQSWRAVQTEDDFYTRSLAVVADSGISHADMKAVLGGTAEELFGFIQ